MKRPESLQAHAQNHDRKPLRSWLAFTAVVVALAGFVAPSSARTIDYCSNVNTGSDYDALVDTYQSNGLCYDKCAGYAFAIVQGSSCWCSNYVPSTETTGCDDNCPGYPDDKCGNVKKDLYGYMSLPLKPSGTKGPTSTSSTQSKTSTSSSSSSSTKETSKSSDTTLTTSTKSRTTEAPSVTVVTTVGGFVTIIASSTPAESSSKPQATAEQANTGGDFFSDTRRAAGLIVGIILALLLIAAAVLFWRYRQNKKRALLYGSQSSASGSIPVGGAGVFGRRRSRSLSTLGLVGEKGAPAMQQSPTTSQTGSTPNATESTPQVGEIFDQRLDPGQLFMRFDHRTGSSRMSVRSLRDDTDYSRRVLRLANPDE